MPATLRSHISVAILAFNRPRCINVFNVRLFNPVILLSLYRVRHHHILVYNILPCQGRLRCKLAFALLHLAIDKVIVFDALKPV